MCKVFPLSSSVEKLRKMFNVFWPSSNNVACYLQAFARVNTYMHDAGFIIISNASGDNGVTETDTLTNWLL